MQKKNWLVLLLAVSLFALTSCAKGFAGTEWKIAGSVDAFGNEQNSVNPNGAFSTLTIAFMDDKSGALRMEGASYPFTYKQDKDITVTLQDGLIAKMTKKGDKIYLTLADITFYFQKK